MVSTEELYPASVSAAEDRAVARVRSDAIARHRSATRTSIEPPMRAMSRLVRQVAQACRDEGISEGSTRRGVIDCTIGDVDVRAVTEQETRDGRLYDYRTLADDLGVALPGEVIGGRIATGETYRWLRDEMCRLEGELLQAGVDLRVYDIAGRGNRVLRGWIADDAARWGYTVDAEHTAIGLGATDCLEKVFWGLSNLENAARRASPGGVLFPSPGYRMPQEQAAHHGFVVHHVPTSDRDAFQLDPDALRVALESVPDLRAVYLTPTGNPSANSYEPARLRAIREAIADHVARTGMPVHLIADVAYVGTGDPEAERAMMAALSVGLRPQESVLLVGSLSKTHTLTGDRFGWVVCSRRDVAEDLGVAWTTTTATLPADWQLRYMAVHRLSERAPHVAEHVRGLYRLRRHRLEERLRRLDAQSDLFDEVSCGGDATLYVWARLAPGEDCFSVFEKTGIAGMPGSMFGASDRYVRFSVGMRPVDDIDKRHTSVSERA